MSTPHSSHGVASLRCLGYRRLLVADHFTAFSTLYVCNQCPFGAERSPITGSYAFHCVLAAVWSCGCRSPLKATQ